MNSNVRIIDSQLIDKVKEKAIQSPRKRMNYNFHELDETYQRFLNILCKGTYVRPHRHTTPPKAETFLILEGKISFLIFSDDGNVMESHILEAGGPNYGIDILPGVWHSLVCLSDTAVCFEGKHGPYNPASDKDFAKWAPLENSKEATEYLVTLEKDLNRL
jgi:cupin fold WbuC family metalloprotein